MVRVRNVHIALHSLTVVYVAVTTILSTTTLHSLTHSFTHSLTVVHVTVTVVVHSFALS